ncbi:hypothetical protein LIX17_06750 [Mycobacterium avium subsp. hominissuis]|uniref:Uncharacterized protein n=1 Tax=Mycobacterium bouchedurhonense TaxID=701041 RepID=A0AAW5S316_MYCBC|nr:MULTISPECIES: hypothetical protein [Mycobacterium avium complex (MAC)]APA75081.2 hypothetical protein KV38_06710 [Mycobacterium avium subsp. hominissuis]MBG0729832.1 hypothetical protein [Mycobacterium avium]MBZ4612744.1 hypothetical protein [Mycobacterium avium subsp. hominissuis]MCV6989786.1 hypothetical protein [Mycobacterium bouchedurhonense]MCV6995356.1 hypothetical protein [Mycobacterium timonense]
MQLTRPTGRYGQLRCGGHVAYADDPHEPFGLAVEIPAVEYGQPLPGTVRVAFYDFGGNMADIMEARSLVPVSERRLLPRPGRVTPYQRRAIAGCPWCDTLGLVDGQDGDPVFCDHRAADAAVVRSSVDDTT